MSDLRAAGFSDSGEVIIIATSSDVEILRRAGYHDDEADGALRRR
jgi:hypothetical protein